MPYAGGRFGTHSELEASVNIPESLKLRGNVNRIMEMKKKGKEPSQIAEVFCNHGIKIDAAAVTAIISSYDALTSKALPKSAISETVKPFDPVEFTRDFILRHA